ncbi:hypothetical protein ABZ725_08725 [Streptomyces sp. NPDC006872]|uniref:hypothetical protein n=1 Tax=Streptomyces sp. NPDC006872 TaxID=3155720 RepID=UPI0033D209BA
MAREGFVDLLRFVLGGPVPTLENSPAGTLLFERGNGLLCAINLTDHPIPLPDAGSPLLASGPVTEDGLLPLDTTVLLHLD